MTCLAIPDAIATPVANLKVLRFHSNGLDGAYFITDNLELRLEESQ